MSETKSQYCFFVWLFESNQFLIRQTEFAKSYPTKFSIIHNWFIVMCYLMYIFVFYITFTFLSIISTSRDNWKIMKSPSSRSCKLTITLISHQLCHLWYMQRMEHLFFECSKSIGCSLHVGLQVWIPTFTCTGLISAILSAARLSTTTKVWGYVMEHIYIWMHRTNKVWNNVVETIQQIVDQAETFFE